MCVEWAPLKTPLDDLQAHTGELVDLFAIFFLGLLLLEIAVWQAYNVSQRDEIKYVSESRPRIFFFR